MLRSEYPFNIAQISNPAKNETKADIANISIYFRCVKDFLYRFNNKYTVQNN